MAKISVIITVYNLDDYISRSVKSVIQQTFDDLELIVVDDGSTDDSLNKINEFAKKDKRISVIHTENHGVSEARNTGLKQASGDWVLFVDGDDFLLNDALEKMWEKTDNCDIVVCNYSKVYADHTDPPFYHLPTEEEANSPDRIPRFIEAQLEIGNGQLNKLYRREFLLKSGVWFEPREEIFAEDLYFNCKILKFAGRIRIVDQVLSGYYQRIGSETYSYKENLLKRSIQFLDGISSWYNNQYDKALRNRAVRLYFEVLRNEAMHNYKSFKSVTKNKHFRDQVKKIDYANFSQNRRIILRLLRFPSILYLVFKYRLKRRLK